MSLNRYDAKRDETERDIIRALVKAGCLVMQLDKVDLAVQRGRGKWFLEVKSRNGTLTDRQEALMANGWDIHIVRTPEEALHAVGL